MTDETIMPFLFDGEITVRVVWRDNAHWFVATDVCRALGLTNASEAVRDLDEDEKGISTTDTLRGHQEVIVVSESGLYSLIFRSRKPNAVKFRKWVTSEVLPSLRRKGFYVVSSGGETFPLKPWTDWSLEETRSKLAQVTTARQVFNQASAAWLWEQLGFPVPPRHLLPAWWQSELYLPHSRAVS